MTDTVPLLNIIKDIENLIKKIKPNILYTLIDNNINFYKLKNLITNNVCFYIYIQNGLRIPSTIWKSGL